MMTPDDVLAFVISKLKESGVSYMVVGSFASNLYGVPRVTLDADLVVEITANAIDVLADSLKDRFYFDAEGAKRATEEKRMFNLIHFETGFKVDLIVRKDRPFSMEEFQRRKAAELSGQPCWFATAEDTILTKLEWSRMGESERQYRDALNIAKVQAANLDTQYLRKWAPILGVSDLLEELLRASS